MLDIFLSVIISFGITLIAIPAIIKVSEEKMLFDVPDARKIHISPIPSLGGLGIFAGFVITCLITISFQNASEFQFFIAASLVIFFLGIKDDILIISPMKKFIGQFIAAFLVIFKGGVAIKSMHGFLGIHELPVIFSILLTYFTVLVIINSFNLIDGVDGLAGSLGFMASTIFGLYFLKIELIPYACLSLALSGSLAAFLIFNFQPAKIFMGDTGSLLIGLITSILVIKFINVSGDPNISFRVEAAPAIGFAVLMIPLLDTLRVFAIRIINKRSPFSADRNHVHHLLLDRGLTHQQVTMTLVSVNLAFIALAFFGRSMGCTLLIFSMISLFFAGIGILYESRQKQRVFVPRPRSKQKKIGSSKILIIKDALLEEK
ncbi:MAG: MraY family glycosyltransferase [Chitinophagaceae bacterium]